MLLLLLLILLLILLLPILLDDAIGLAVVFDVDVADDAAKPVFAFALGGGGGGGGGDDDDVGFAAVNPPPTAPPFPFPPLVVLVGVVVFGALLFKLFPCFLCRFFAFAYHRL